MWLASLARRLRYGPFDLVRFALGRFSSVRTFYSAFRGITSGRALTGQSAGGMVQPFAPLDAVKDLRRQSVYLPLILNPEAVDSLVLCASSSTIHCPIPGVADMTMTEAAAHNLRSPENPFLYGSVPSAATHPMVLNIANDPGILETARQYLGYVPQRRRTRLQWSFVCEMEDSARMARGQTVFYHYDADDFNFLYLMFYLTDTDAQSGAHVMIPATHRRKPFSWLLGRTWRTDAEVLQHYKPSDEMSIPGPAGFGFLQDSSCIHKATVPVTRPRLVLQVRYS